MAKSSRFFVLLALAGAGLAMLALVLLVVGRIWVFNFYWLPQDGMWPTLPAEERVFAWRRPYRDPSRVSRGDIVVFERLLEGKTYVTLARIVGLPGERIDLVGREILIDGTAVSREKLGAHEESELYREHAGERSYVVAYRTDAPPRDPASHEVPPAQFFVLGDNRNLSYDSDEYGPIPFESIVARLARPRREERKAP
jgi:signal peptidase I